MKVFVFVRQDLDHAQQLVQACHAVTELSLLCMNQAMASPLRKRYWDWARRHKTIVMLRVADHEALAFACYQLKQVGETPAVFREPDRANEATAAAFLAMNQKNFKCFSLA